MHGHVRLRSHTVFHRINAPAGINAPPSFEFDWPYLRNYPTNLHHILPHKVKVFRGPQCKFHQNQAWIRVSFSVSAPGEFIQRHTVHISL